MPCKSEQHNALDTKPERNSWIVHRQREQNMNLERQNVTEAGVHSMDVSIYNDVNEVKDLFYTLDSANTKLYVYYMSLQNRKVQLSEAPISGRPEFIYRYETTQIQIVYKERQSVFKLSSDPTFMPVRSHNLEIQHGIQDMAI